MVGTAVGVILGALATVLVSRYYFLRSTRKSLGVYGLLNSFVFAGIAPDVRSQLHFHFRDREVDEVQQLVFLVANDGERAISNAIEPLTLLVPPGVEVLDASILHRHPESLQVKVVVTSQGTTGSAIALQFPLLNKQEFFAVKLLLSGGLSEDGLTLRILVDDLPRSVQIKELPPSAAKDSGYKFEWGLAAAGVFVLVFSAWICYAFYLLYKTRPELFPYPLSSFPMSIESLFLLIPGGFLLLLFSLLGLLMLGAAVFGGEFPPARGPHFPLPKELRRAVFSHRMLRFQEDLSESDVGAPRALSNRRKAV